MTESKWEARLKKAIADKGCNTEEVAEMAKDATKSWCGCAFGESYFIKTGREWPQHLAQLPEELFYEKLKEHGFTEEESNYLYELGAHFADYVTYEEYDDALMVLRSIRTVMKIDE